MSNKDSGDKRNGRSDLYRDKVILAPMVRENNLPFRLLCLKYGADLVYTEELIDYKLSKCRRLVNKVLGTIDFIDERGELVLRTDPKEKDHLILQMGSNNFERFAKAAKLVASDISGLDFNFGCPKSFSLSGGMGAALLEKPDAIKELLTQSVAGLNLPITCKIRVLPDKQKTLDLVKMIETCGVSALAVHGRTKDQRPRHENQDDILCEIAKILRIPMIANGGSNNIKSYSDILKFKDKTNASSVMIARSAMKNPSIFRSDNTLEAAEVVAKEYLKLAVKYDNFLAQTKYTMQSMLSSGHFSSEMLRKFHLAPDYQTLCDIFDLSDWYFKNKLTATKNDYYEPEHQTNDDLEKYIDRKKEYLLTKGISEFVLDTVSFNARFFTLSPKGQLNDYMNKILVSPEILSTTTTVIKPEYEVVKLDGQRGNQYYCSIVYNNVFYLNKSFASSKKHAEHATSILVLHKLGILKADKGRLDLNEYKTRVNACNRNIA